MFPLAALTFVNKCNFLNMIGTNKVFLLLVFLCFKFNPKCSFIFEVPPRMPKFKNKSRKQIYKLVLCHSTSKKETKGLVCPFSTS